MAAVALSIVALALVPQPEADAVASLPSGFQESVVFSGLNNPTAVEFAKGGKVFVAEKSGLIKVFDGLSDTTPTVFADLRTNTYNFWDRGLLGMALDPNFPTRPYVYVLYAHDAPIGGTAPRWGQPGVSSDPCPTPPGATGDGCVVSGRLSRLQASGNTTTGGEKVLIEDWCQQYPSHSIGSINFGADGALYVSGGEGASFTFTDYGQAGSPPNPCGDPPVGVGGTQTLPGAQGGALRSQDLRTAGDSVGLSGTIARVEPDTGAALPTNPLAGNPDPNARRIVAHGMRNPFRFTIRPGTNEVWAGDVGGGKYEEINRVANPTGGVKNFGWPCYEGTPRHPGWDALNVNVCENLYSAGPGAVTAPYFAYDHAQKVVAGETCSTGSSSISGMAFYNGGSYPTKYSGALFFSDYSRKCIWAMFKGANGLPDPQQRATFVAGAENPVGLKIGPGGDLFYVDFSGGTIRRVEHFAANTPPKAAATATPTSGPTPLTVNFDGTKSTDADAGDTLSYAWDLDGDGAYNDSTSPKPSRTYTTTGNRNVGLKVTDSRGASDTLDQPLVISAGNSPPTATITQPGAIKWKVGQKISFSGSATDPQEGTLPSSALSWSLVINHCYSANICHKHPIQDYPGVASGSFVAPDHEYPSYLELSLTATDKQGLKNTKKVRLDPQTVKLTFQTRPTGLKLLVGDNRTTTPFSRTVIVGSSNSIGAPSPQQLGGKSYRFVSWSDGKAQNHVVTAPTTATTYTASYKVTGAVTDTTKPTVSRVTPTPGSRIRYRKPTIRATVRDNVTDLRKANIALFVDGKRKPRFTYDRRQDRLSYTTRRLAYKRHVVKVVARDAAGNRKISRWSFWVVKRG
ncbi:MAG: PQQ-dependent sugar dehydrogenase [Ornithinimicrobium sp.]